LEFVRDRGKLGTIKSSVHRPSPKATSEKKQAPVKKIQTKACRIPSAVIWLVQALTMPW